MLLGKFKFIILMKVLEILLMYVHVVHTVDSKKVVFDLSYLSSEVN